MAFVEFRDVCKIYQMGEVEVAAVSGMSFDIEQGELVVVVGPSKNLLIYPTDFNKSSSDNSDVFGKLGALSVKGTSDFSMRAMRFCAFARASV